MYAIKPEFVLRIAYKPVWRIV